MSTNNPSSHNEQTYTATPEESVDEQTNPDQVVTNWKPQTGTNHCLQCGGDIPADVARVFGDDDGRVVCCANCTTNRNGGSFDTHSRVLQKALGGNYDEL